MITYELASTLKKVGFPQEGRHWANEYNDDICNCSMSQNEGSGPDRKTDTYMPTLSELIDACGERFYQLRKMIPANNNPVDWSWIAYDRDDDFHGGFTAEEAVANLWLALNEKK